MSAFERALSVVLKAEGGFIDDPADTGGATNRGITQRTYDRWRTDRFLEAQSVELIAEHEVEAIYFEYYWREGHSDQMPELVAIVHFDGSVNLGIAGAAKVLQKAVGVEADGIIGSVTLGAVMQADPDQLVEAILWERIRYYREITRDESNALVKLARAVREERWADVRELVDKAEGLKFIRWWIERILDLREGL